MWRHQKRFVENVNKYCSLKQSRFIERSIEQKRCGCHNSGIVPTPDVECREDIIDRRYNIVRASVYAVPVTTLSIMGYSEPFFAEFGSFAGILWGLQLSVPLHGILSMSRYNIPFFSNSECCDIRSFDVAEAIRKGIKSKDESNYVKGMKNLNAKINIEKIEKHIKK